MLRKVGVAVAAVGVVMFIVGFLWLSITGGSSCTGKQCFEGLWVLLPTSVLTVVGGLVMISVGGRGYGHSRGPATFDQVDSGAFSPRDRGRRDADGSSARPARWSRSWRNTYALLGFGELGLALLFTVAGLLSKEYRGTGFLSGGLLGAVALPFLYVWRRAAAKDRLHDTGLPATGRILGLTQTGTWVNNNPYVRLDLEVTVPGHPPYEVRHGEIVPLVVLGRLTDGTLLHLKVDRDRPSHFVIEWERG